MFGSSCVGIRHWSILLNKTSSVRVVPISPPHVIPGRAAKRRARNDGIRRLCGSFTGRREVHCGTLALFLICSSIRTEPTMTQPSALSVMRNRAAVAEELRRLLPRMEGYFRAAQAVPLGLSIIDRHLPRGGLPCGAL